MVVVEILPIGAIIKEKEKMKKSTLFKILTLFLTFVITLSSSGCEILRVLRGGPSDVRLSMVEKQKERKELLDSFIPEVEGYIFEALPKDIFDGEEDWKSKGYLTWREFVDRRHMLSIIKKESNHYEVSVADHTELYFETEFCKITIAKDIFEKQIGRFEGLYDIEFTHTYIIDYEAMTQTYYGEFFNGYAHYKDGEYFVVLAMNHYREKYFYISGPPALFLIDVENNALHYVGYAKGWLEYEIENYRFLGKDYYCYKLTKEGE